jgi:ABC-type uncharacterized transport system permease subunit
LPLTFFPGIFGTILQSLPFAAIYSVPLQIYIGQLPPSQWGIALATQCGWIAVFGIASIVVWRLAERRVVIQGG